MGYSPFMLALGFALSCLGIGIASYLLKLCLESYGVDRKQGKQDPEYIRDLNRRLRYNKVETERDLI